MNTCIDKLKALVAKCKCEVTVTINEHHNYHTTVCDELRDMEQHGPLDIDPEVRAKMLELDTMVRVQFYPSTPVGFYRVYHYDIDAALTKALGAFT